MKISVLKKAEEGERRRCHHVDADHTSTCGLPPILRGEQNLTGYAIMPAVSLTCLQHFVRGAHLEARTAYPLANPGREAAAMPIHILHVTRAKFGP
jgi:hypothetical protein